MNQFTDQLEKLQQKLEKTDARVRMNETALKELAITCDAVRDESGRKIRGVLY